MIIETIGNLTGPHKTRLTIEPFHFAKKDLLRQYYGVLEQTWEFGQISPVLAFYSLKKHPFWLQRRVVIVVHMYICILIFRISVK